MIRRTRVLDVIAIDDDPLWYKDAILYELHVRAFRDTNGDGIGDFPGVIEKLDYLQDLGITALWLLPFYPSPLRDDGYDIADYTSVNPIYGTLDDFQRLLDEAHRRGLRVITELVINHTSDQHPWFQRARRSPPGSVERDFYVWSDTRDRYKEARIIFKDFELSNWTWDPVANAYYWHRFYSHQPDLNYDTPEVPQAVFRVLDFWLDRGVDGFRLDAIPYLYERDGTSCENLPQTHVFLKELRAYLDGKYKNRVLLAEANQWPEDAAAYFGGTAPAPPSPNPLPPPGGEGGARGSGDECHMCFHFPIMPRLFMSIHMEDRYPIVDILQQTPDIPENCQWALFLRNHDELTLEMVTEDDRDYMYRVYAQDPQARINLGIRRRLAPLLQNHRRKIELMNGLLLSLPGTPVIYYGDEIGMGDNMYLGDRNGVRTPMQWSAERNAGFSSANPQRLYLPAVIDPEFHYEMVNVETQQANLHSLLWWMKRLFALRKRHQAFGRGSLEMLTPDNPKTLAFVRRYPPYPPLSAPGGERKGEGGECILVVANLSRFVQCLRVDMSAYKGMTPIELMGRTPFPVIGETPYFLTLGPHSFYWFILKPQPAAPLGTVEPPLLTVGGSLGWTGIFRGRARQALEEALPNYLQSRPWFQGRLRSLKSTTLREVIPLAPSPPTPLSRSGGEGRKNTPLSPASGERPETTPPLSPASGERGRGEGNDATRLVLVQADYHEGESDVYLLPLAFAPATEDTSNQASSRGPIVARLRIRAQRDSASVSGVLYDPSGERGFVEAILDLLGHGGRPEGEAGELRAEPERAFASEPIPAGLRLLEESNTVVVLGDRLLLKLYRRVEEGLHPEVEMNRVLPAKTTFTQFPALLGAVHYRPLPDGRQATTLGIVREFVPSEGNAWRLTLDALERFFDRILAGGGAAGPPPVESGPQSLVGLSEGDIPGPVQEHLGSFLETARLLARRTAELHVALASVTDDPAFAPEPFTVQYQRSLYQSMRSRIRQALGMLRQRLDLWPEPLREPARRVIQGEDKLIRLAHRIFDHPIDALRIRGHGHLHLGHLLFTGKDFLIIDLEGEADRSFASRRRKRSPARDLTGLHRSLQEVAQAALTQGGVRTEDVPTLEPWARFWQRWASVAFLKEYRSVPGTAFLLPRDPPALAVLLDFYRLGWDISALRHELAAPSERAGMLLVNLSRMIETT